MAFAYYIPAQRLVMPKDTDPDVIAFLYTLYMRHLPPEQEPGLYDGASIETCASPFKSQVLVCLGREVKVIPAPKGEAK